MATIMTNDYQSIFDYFHENHGLILTIGEIQDIIEEVKKTIEILER